MLRKTDRKMSTKRQDMHRETRYTETKPHRYKRTQRETKWTHREKDNNGDKRTCRDIDNKSRDIKDTDRKRMHRDKTDK